MVATVELGEGDERVTSLDTSGPVVRSSLKERYHYEEGVMVTSLRKFEDRIEIVDPFRTLNSDEIRPFSLTAVIFRKWYQKLGLNEEYTIK